MLERCRDKAQRAGLNPDLFVQSLHELHPPRRYRTIVACGVFGLGSTRIQDQEALRRFHHWLEPGGTLLLDNQAPYANAPRWQLWIQKERDKLPEPWPPSGSRKRAADGSEYELRTRDIALDPIDQTCTKEIRADKRMNGACVASEVHTISIRMYFRDELLLMLEKAGFADVEIQGDYTDKQATSANDFLVYIARR